MFDILNTMIILFFPLYKHDQSKSSFNNVCGKKTCCRTGTKNSANFNMRRIYEYIIYHDKLF